MNMEGELGYHHWQGGGAVRQLTGHVLASAVGV